MAYLKRNTLFVLGAVFITVAACGQGGDEPAPKTEGGSQMASSAQPSMAETPFMPAEMKMHEAMMAASGSDVSEAWARKMIPHHQGALDMSEVVLRTGDDPEIRRMAQKTIEMQTKDIAELRSWLEKGASGAAGAPAQGSFAPVETRMKEAMMSASSPDADHAWARKMVAHHQGALDMSAIVLEDSQDAEVRRMAQKTIEMQRREIGELEAWLAKHPAPAAT